jgi:hypothetical protein
MKKRVFYFLMIINFIFINLAFINAAQLSIGPSELFINGTVGEESCKEIKITSDYIGNLIGEIKWARNSNKELKDYTLNPEYFKIIENYPEKIYFYGKDIKTFKICFKGEKQGKYNGLLIYKTERGYAGIGIWVHLKLENKKIDKTKLILYSSPTTLLFFLLFLLILKRNNLLFKPFPK